MDKKTFINKYCEYAKIANIILTILIIVLIIFKLCSCSKTNDLGFKTYIIETGNHYTLHNIELLTSNALVFNAVFDSSAIYFLNDSVEQYDINKLYGFSDCNNNHQVNSARFGWRYINNNLELFAYCYNNKQKTVEYITNIEINKVYNYEIIIYEDCYRFKVDGKIVDVSRTKECNTGVYYKLFPYFGGTQPAPHQVSIKIKEC